MFDREAVLHDADIIAHLAGRLDMSDREQIRAVLLMQKKDGMMKSEYGKRFIGRLIGAFTDREVPKTDIFTGEKLYGDFPVNDMTIRVIRANPDKFISFLEKKENPQPEKKPDPVSEEKGEEVKQVQKAPEKTEPAGKVQKTPEKPEKPSFYQQQELEYRRRIEKVELADQQMMQEKAELKAAEEALDKEEAQYKAIADTARKAAGVAKGAVDSAKNTASDISSRVYEFSRASGNEGNSPSDLFADIEKPWKYLRIYWKVFLLFLLFGYWFIMTKSTGAIVPEMILGVGMIPFAVLLYLDEINGIYEKRMPVRSAIYTAILGAIMALILTWITGIVFASVPLINSIFAGFMDELIIFVTLLAVIMHHIRKNGRNATVLQGIWYGASFGTGFSVYQVCQIALSGYLSDSRAGVFMWKLISQSLLSVGGHIAWSSICGGALSVIVTEVGVIRSYDFGKMCASAVLFPIIMQILWELPYASWGLYGFSVKNVIIALISLWVVNIFMHRGIREAIIARNEEAARSAHQESSHKTEEIHS